MREWKKLNSAEKGLVGYSLNLLISAEEIANFTTVGLNEVKLRIIHELGSSHFISFKCLSVPVSGFWCFLKLFPHTWCLLLFFSDCYSWRHSGHLPIPLKIVLLCFMQPYIL